MVVGYKAATGGEGIAHLFCDGESVPLIVVNRHWQVFLVGEVFFGSSLHGAGAKDAVHVMGFQPLAAGAVGEVGRSFKAGQDDKIVCVELGAVVGVAVVLAQAEKVVALAFEEGDGFLRGEMTVRIGGVAVEVSFVEAAAFGKNGCWLKHGQAPFRRRGWRDSHAPEWRAKRRCRCRRC